MRRPLRVLALFASLWVGFACLEPVSPIQPIFSLTSVLLPFPSIAQHDTLRDTSGVVKPLRVIGFNAKGDTVDTTLYTVSFLAIDTTHQLIVNNATGFARGDTTSPLAKVVGTVTLSSNGKSIQTLQVPLPIVPPPDTAVGTIAPFNVNCTLFPTETVGLDGAMSGGPAATPVMPSHTPHSVAAICLQAVLTGFMSPTFTNGSRSSESTRTALCRAGQISRRVDRGNRSHRRSPTGRSPRARARS